MDQATSLRNVFRDSDMDIPISATLGGNVYLVTSGKGGVGKSMLSLNLAYTLGTAESPVLLIDANSHGSHLDMMIGCNPTTRLDEVVSGTESILNAIDRSYSGVHLLAGPDGIPLDRNFDVEMRSIISANINRFSLEYPNVIIDGGSSNLENLELFSKISTSVILVCTPELTAITDTYALAKYLIMKSGGEVNIQILINKSKTEDDGREISFRLNLMTENFLQHSISYIGFVKSMKEFPDSIENQYPVVLDSKSRSINKMFSQILENLSTNKTKQYENEIEYSLMKSE